MNEKRKEKQKTRKKLAALDWAAVNVLNSETCARVCYFLLPPFSFSVQLLPSFRQLPLQYFVNRPRKKFRALSLLLCNSFLELFCCCCRCCSNCCSNCCCCSPLPRAEQQLEAAHTYIQCFHPLFSCFGVTNCSNQVTTFTMYILFYAESRFSSLSIFLSSNLFHQFLFYCITRRTLSQF